MSKSMEKPESSGTMVDILRNVGKGLGALSFVAGILGLVAAAIGLILIVAIHEVRIFKSVGFDSLEQGNLQIRNDATGSRE